MRTEDAEMEEDDSPWRPLKREKVKEENVKEADVATTSGL